MQQGLIGLQFENLVIKNTLGLLPLLKVDRSDVVRFGPYFQGSTQRRKGCQIDLLIQTEYRTIYLCEIEFSSDAIGVSVLDQARRQQRDLSVPRGWSKRSALIHVNGVTAEVVQSGVFDHIVDFADLILI